MKGLSLSGSFRQSHWLILGLFALFGCNDRAPTGLSPSAVALAKSAGGTGPSVKATDPDTATIDTTLNVRVFGSGYDQGSRANWAYKGVVSDKIVTNSTIFVSSTELVANITIARNADLGGHDVIVTTSAGKGGIGTELFVVTLKPTGLGTLGGLTSFAWAVNNSAQVVGESKLATGEVRAFLWTKAGGMRNLGTLGGTSSRAYDINDAGQVVGASTNASGQQRPFLWTEAEGMRDIGRPDGSYGGGYGINSYGDVAMEGRGGNVPTGGAFYRSSPGVLEEVNTVTAYPDDVNNASQVVGFMSYTSVTGATSQAVLWSRTAGGWEEKPLGFLSGGNISDARAINDAGQVVGYSRSSEAGIHAMIWTASGGMKQLPNFPRRSQSRAWNISNSGDVVGSSQTSSGQSRATLWSPVPGGWNVTDLAGVLYGTSVATGVNDLGQVVGAGVLAASNSSYQQAILWEFR
jgi:probable HAF family extracellular repeat protein